MLHYKRSDRLGDLIQREISDILHKQIKDPRIGFCTVMRVDVSDDLRHAKVRVSIMGSENQQERSLEGLKSAKNFIKKEIGNRIALKHIPELVFVLDHSVDYSLRIDKLIKEEHKKDKSRNPENDTEL
ncbi:30S ribosome-binding factor RbfA [Candidatus Poribacteria bacterium]|nr:30S ribosome-binding factor RbfA [Candidatus Poribacteria bacterium]